MKCWQYISKWKAEIHFLIKIQNKYRKINIDRRDREHCLNVSMCHLTVLCVTALNSPCFNWRWSLQWVVNSARASSIIQSRERERLICVGVKASQCNLIPTKLITVRLCCHPLCVAKQYHSCNTIQRYKDSHWSRSLEILCSDWWNLMMLPMLLCYVMP